MSKIRTIIESPNAPAPVGPYNQAILAGNMLFISGQIAIDPATGNLVQDTIEAETRQVLNNLNEVVKAADMTMADIVKCSVFVADMNMYARINAVYGEYFDEQTAPARELVEVANLPKFVQIEISAIAYKN